ncbi:MAG TPA: nucleotidyltransferase domain-containing protein [Acidimicrobiales bacterium]|nr:nucleotidyltransferase domain-containing protein [Acidimicrobiales bacterium]
MGKGVLEPRQVTVELADGKALYDGRTLADWVPTVIADLVAACDPVQVILFGSVARGEDGPDSDIDVLVVLSDVDRATRHELVARLRRAITAPVPVDVFLTDPAEIERRRDVIGSLLYWPVREGRVVHGRAA